jgi:hypothetical protein
MNTVPAAASVVRVLLMLRLHLIQLDLALVAEQRVAIGVVPDAIMNTIACDENVQVGGSPWGITRKQLRPTPPLQWRG